MDLKLFAVTFFSILLAELGDKTQLATFSFAASNRHALVVVFAASALALVTTSAVGVLAGGALARLVDPKYLRIGAGILFIIIGLATLALPDRKRQRAFERLGLELERYAAIEKCKGCAKFQAVVRDIAAHGHPELEDVLEELKVEPGEQHEPLGCENCSAERIARRPEPHSRGRATLCPVCAER